MKSMTGFGKAHCESPDYYIDISIKTVNGRFLEVKVHSPKVYQPLEIEIRKRMARFFKRGTLDVYINRKVFNGSENVIFNKALAKTWLKGFHQLARDVQLEPDKKASVLFQVPDLFKVDESQSVSIREKKDFFKCMDQAAEACAKLRSSEGKSLSRDIAGHIKSLEKCSKQIHKMRDQLNKTLEKRYRQRLEKVGLPGELDPQRLAQEIVIQVDRLDISEEVQRLQAHIQAVHSLMKSKESIGKKMDFYAQELLREVNTMGSKASSADLTQLVVECKGHIEKYREQVQNVE